MMIETALALEPTAPHGGKPAARDPAARNDVAPSFSFASAMSALTGRAAQSLETFGAAPQGAAPGQTSQTQPSSNRSAPAEARAEAPQTPSSAAAKAGDAASQAPSTANPQTPPQAAAAQVSAAPTAATATAAAAPFAGLQPPPSAPTQPIRSEALAAAKLDAARANASKAPRAPAAPQPLPQPATEDFAKLLAKRLDGGATKFELRLDPPELGRVEAHLKVGDKGDAVLSLKFDNQATLDHFARDADALRNALLSAGFDLGGERLAFSLAGDHAPADETVSAAAAASIEQYEPVFLAPYSNGAVDLRV